MVPKLTTLITLNIQLFLLQEVDRSIGEQIKGTQLVHVRPENDKQHLRVDQQESENEFYVIFHR